MFDFKEDMICSECNSDEYKLFVHPKKGQGIRCKSCGHEKVIVTTQKKSHKNPLKQRMREGWDSAKKSKERTF
jgi:DNA-directed RNA polymerase subunit RPC12/RpoP